MLRSRGAVNEPARQLLELAIPTRDPMLLTIAHMHCSIVHAYHGDHRECIEHSDATLAMLDIERERVIGRMLNLSACVAAAGYPIFAHWNLAFPNVPWRPTSAASPWRWKLATEFARVCAHVQDVLFYLQGDPDRIISERRGAPRGT